MLGSEYIAIFDTKLAARHDCIDQLNAVLETCRELKKAILVLEISDLAGWNVSHVRNPVK